MKIPNKRELQQIASNHSSYIGFTKDVPVNHIFFLINDATFASDNPLRFRQNLLNI